MYKRIIGMLKPRQIVLLVMILLLASGALAGCSSNGSKNHASGLSMAPMSDMPAEVQSAPVVVQEAYQFAAANPDTLEELPCYCGCGAMGHTSNYSCYFSGTNPDGSLAFDSHALGCSICVDITQDAIRMLKQGKDVPEIRSYVDETYARFGPSNIP